MTYRPMQRLSSFHRAAGVRPFEALDDAERRDLLFLRWDLVYEESNEALEEIDNSIAGEGDIKALAKELADILVVVYGTAELLGIPLEEIFDEVMDSNMSKVEPPLFREDGKILKGPNYFPADLDKYWELGLD